MHFFLRYIEDNIQRKISWKISLGRPCPVPFPIRMKIMLNMSMSNLNHGSQLWLNPEEICKVVGLMTEEKPIAIEVDCEIFMGLNKPKTEKLLG